MIAIKTLKLKTHKGIIDLKPGDTFRTKDPELLIRAGVAEPITQEVFNKTFDCLAIHLHQRDYTPEDIGKLKAPALEMDDAWEAMDYPRFKEAIEKMVKKIPGILRIEGDKPIGAKIYSHILQDHVWIAISPSFQPDDGIPVYYPEEIRNLKGATPKEINIIHLFKKELGGKLVAVGNNKGNQ